MIAREERRQHTAVFLLASVVASRLISKVAAVYAMIQGLAIIIGGADRFGAATYTIALKAPGAPESWGAVLFTAGVVMVVGLTIHRPRVTAIGVFAVAAWSMFFALAFAHAAWRYPDANLTGMWVYGKDAVLFTIVGLVKWSQPKPSGDQNASTSE